MFIQENVETEKLVEIVRAHRGLLPRFVQRRLRGDDGFNSYVLDLGPDLDNIHVIRGSQIFPKAAQRPHVALALVRIVVRPEVRVEFVHARVREVHKLVRQGVHVIHVFFRSQPHQTLLVHVYPERIDAGQQHVQPQVEFDAVDQSRRGDVSLHDERPIRRYLVQMGHYLDPAPRATIWRLNDPKSAVLLHKFAQQVSLVGQDERQRYEIEILASELSLHPSEILREGYFVTQLDAAREMIHLRVNFRPS